MKMPATILIVEDDEEIGMMMQLTLKHKGFNVLILTRAIRVEETILEHGVNLVILDVLIADVKGTDVCARLKSNKATAGIPVLMITALPDAEKECRQAGTDDFLYKPFEFKDLMAKVHSLTGSAQKT